jgi:hypothetical protein
MLITLTTPPDGALALFRSDIIVGVEPAFPWSDGAMARTVHLATGQTVIVQDTADNVSACRHAIDQGGAAVIATADVAYGPPPETSNG